MHREAEKRAGRARDHVIAVEVQRHALAVRAVHLLDERALVERSRRRKAERGHERRVLGEQRIRRELLLHKTGVGLVGVQGGDDVVPIWPRLQPWPVHAEAVRLAVVNHVQPVPRPTLAVAWRGEQPLHQSLIRLRGGVLLKPVHLLRRGRQTVQIEGQPANQRAPVGGGRGRELLLAEPGQDEGVNGIGACRLPVADLRNGRFHQRLQRPPVARRCLATVLGCVAGQNQAADRECRC